MRITKRFTALVLMLCLFAAIFLTTAFAATTNPFADVSTASWQFKAVNYAVENDLMAGKGLDAQGRIIFDPNKSIPREEFAQVLYNAEGKPAVSIRNKFPDVKESGWYKNAVLWANEKDIANGLGNGTFGVTQSIKRQDLAVMLYKYAKMKGYDLSAKAGEIDRYADGGKVAGYARTAMDWAVTNGVLSGKGNKGEPVSKFKLDPTGTATRAECAAMLMNFMAAFDQKCEHTDLTEIKAKDASCTENGNTAYWHCTDCGKYFCDALAANEIEYEDTVIVKKGHTPGAQATCTQPQKCTVCQSVLAEAIGHNNYCNFVGTGALCGTRQLGESICSLCGVTVYTVEHTLNTTTQLPTCTGDGYSTVACENCDYSVSTPIPAAGHTAGQWEITQKASCTQSGTKVRKCTDCNAVVDTGTVPQENHKTVAQIDGDICTYTCQNCGYTEEITIENKFKTTLITGSEELPLVFVEDGQVPQLPAPTKEDYHFLGWYRDESGNIPYENEPITEDTTLYALWQPSKITASDNGIQGVVRAENTNYQFAVISSVALTDSNVDSYITVTSSKKEKKDIFVARSQGNVYYIGGYYTAGDIYEAVAVDGITFEESGSQPLWFVIDGEEREEVTVKTGTVKLTQTQIHGQYSSGEYDYVFTRQDLLNAGDLVVVTGDSDKDLRAIYEVVDENAQGDLYSYQCVIPDPEEVLSQVRLFNRTEIDLSSIVLYDGWEEAVTQSVQSSRAYAAFREAATVYARQRSSESKKYSYTLKDFEITPVAKGEWSSSTKRDELVLGAQISCKLERKDNGTQKVVDVFTLSLNLENRFGMDADISADGILDGDARVVLTTMNTVSVDIVLKLGLMDDDEQQEQYFRDLYKDACGKKDLLPIDTVPEGDETLIPAFYLPIPLGAGFALDVEAYLVLDWEVCGQFGVTFQHKNTMSFGFQLDDWDFKTINYKSNEVTLNAYLSGKMRASAGIRPEVGINWLKIIRAGANVTVSVYAECGGLVGFTVGSNQKFTPMKAGYFECGLNLQARVFGEIGGRVIKYQFDVDVLDEDYPLYSIGTKEMPLNFERDGEEYVVYMDYDKEINLHDRVDTILRTQDLGTMEINRGLAEKCYFSLEEPVKNVVLWSNGDMLIRGCDQKNFDVKVRITSGTVHKTITVHIQVDHEHSYTTTDYPGNCTRDSEKLHKCKKCTYQYWELVEKAPGHDYSQFITDKYPTCTEEGQRHGTCARCSYTATESIPALGHNYSLQILEDAHIYIKATCQNVAKYYYVCVNCGGHSSWFTYEYGGLADHTYADPFTCHDRPCTTRGCTHISVATTEHRWTDWIEIQPGGCSVEGYAMRACRDCGYAETDLENGAVQGHNWQLQPALEPTCDAPGYQDYILCTACAEVANKTVVPPLGHNILYKEITENTHMEYCHRTGCDYTSAPIVHRFGAWEEVIAPKCEKDGKAQRLCDCGFTESKALSATGHSHQETLTKKPTCTEKGLKTFTCHCGNRYTQEVPANGHREGTAVVENKKNATCTADGAYDQVVYCADCHTELSRSQVKENSLGHIAGVPVRENEKESTCADAGSYDKVTYCTRCKEELNRETVSKPLAAHRGEAVKGYEATCAKTGLTDGVKCAVCDVWLTEQKEIPKLKHSYTTQVTKPTCTEKGYTTYTCQCGDSYISDYVDAKGHTSQTDEYVAPTCTKTGLTEGAHCRVCNTVLVAQQEIPAKGHKGQKVAGFPATCTKTGLTDGEKCSVCGIWLTVQKEIPKLAHSYTPKVTEPACTEKGYTTYTCQCGDHYISDYKDAKGHTEVNDAPLDPTCTKTGLTEGKHCSVCNAVIVKQQSIPATGHQKTTVPGCEPTCTQSGLTDGEKCSVCEEVLKKQEVIDPLKHEPGTPVKENEKLPTCTEKGAYDQVVYCNRCNEEISRIAVTEEATGHDHSGAWQSSGNRHYRICSVCKLQIDAEDHTDTAGYLHKDDSHYRICEVCKLPFDQGYHIPVQNGEIKKPACDEDGYTPYKCKQCGFEWNGDVIYATGHNWSETQSFDDACHYYACLTCGEIKPGTRQQHMLSQAVTKEPTCTQPGNLRIYCVLCDYERNEAIQPDHDHSGVWVNTDDSGHYRICGACGEQIDHQDHEFTGYTVKPDCENEGYDQHTCIDCGYRYQDNQTVALGHRNMDKWYVDEVTGEHYHACDRDGCDYETNRSKHSYGQWQVVDAPTCAAYGKNQRTCSACGKVDVDEKVAKLPHSLYETATTAKKAVTGGTLYEHTLVEKCHNCDYTRALGVTVVSAHEKITVLPAKAPTCTQPGKTTGWECAFSGCNDESHDLPQETLEALGHDFVDGYCTRCGEADNTLAYTLSGDGTYYIVSGIGTCTDKQIVIPAAYKGKPVKEIGAKAFDGRSITAVTIPDGVTSIGNAAFSNCSRLTSIVIPDSVTSIGNSAFGSCISLQSVVLPEGVTSIGNNVFHNCTGLTSITIKDGVTSIGDNAFAYCSSLTSVTIPDSVTSIGMLAFRNCSGLKEIYFDGSAPQIGTNAFSGVTATAYYYPDDSWTTSTMQNYGSGTITWEAVVKASQGLAYTLSSDGTYYIVSGIGTCTDTEIVIPATYEGKPVKEIGANAFYNEATITTVTIPDSVTTIGSYAFSRCGNLTEITIGSGITSIVDAAFEKCYCLEVINFNATAMGDLGNKNYVFNEAGIDSNGITLNVGANVTRIPAYLFYSQKTSSWPVKKYTTGISKVIFEDKSRCESIGMYAFAYCNTLIEITMPGNCKSMGTYAFAYCDNLTEITIPSGEIGSYAFYQAGVTKVTIGENVTAIGSSAFVHCDLTCVTICEGVTSIGISAFSSCDRLTSVTLPNSLTTIEKRAFYRCTALTDIVIPNGVDTIGEEVFKECTGLSFVSIGESVKNIGVSAFENCTGMTEISFNATDMNDLSSSSRVFSDAGHTSSGIIVNVGANVTKIPAYLFHSYTDSNVVHHSAKIIKVFFAERSVCKDIGMYAFYGCVDLKEIIIPESVTSIGRDVFDCCASLVEIKIPSGVKTINRGTFFGCTSLTEIRIPESVISIGFYAFSQCINLTEIYFDGSAPEIDSVAFSGVTATAYYYPDETWEKHLWDHGGTITWEARKAPSQGLAYTLSSDGTYYIVDGIGTCTDTEIAIPATYEGKPVKEIRSGAFKNQKTIIAVTIPEGITRIGHSAFYGCTGLQSVTLPKSITSIDGGMFEECKSLTSITIPDGVTNIGDSAFRSCTSLTSIIISDSVTSIGDYAFVNCTSLKNVTIPEGVTSIGNRAFFCCTNLQVITLPQSVTSISTSAFEECTSLTSITIPNSATSIGNSAFYNCTSLTSIIIPDSVTSIEGYALYGCTNLKTVYFEGSQAQWDAISKGSNWNKNCSFTVVCLG